MLTARDLNRIYTGFRPFILRTVRDLIRDGLLSGEPWPAKAIPLPHGSSHEFGGDDELLVDNVSTFCVNRSGVDIPLGKVVYAVGADYDDFLGHSRPSIALASAGVVSHVPPLGWARQEILDGEDGLVTRLGRLVYGDTLATGWTQGQSLYLSDTTPGEVVTTPPGLAYRVGLVLSIDDEVGEVLVQLEDRTDLVGTPTGGFNHRRTMIRAMGRC